MASDGGPKTVPVKYSREGIIREAEVAAGRWALPSTPGRPRRSSAPAASLSRFSSVCAAGRTPGSPAPGERSRPSRALFPDGDGLHHDGPTSLRGNRAGPGPLRASSRASATSTSPPTARPTHDFAYRTALILAPDPDSSADPTALETDGTITAEQIARTWQLDADLVVLSACESGLGQAAGAEGYLGFAQPLFARGARSLVLSQWKVDDDATALLMARFYRNLLGKREGLEVADAQGRGIGRGQAMAPIRRAGGGGRGAGGAAPRRHRPPRGGEGRTLGASVRGPDLLGGVPPYRGSGLTSCNLALARILRCPGRALSDRGRRRNRLDWGRRKAYVEPAEDEGRSCWRGQGQYVSAELCGAIRRLLAGEAASPAWSRRAVAQMATIRSEFSWLAGDDANVLRSAGGEVGWWTFAGGRANAALTDELGRRLDMKVSSDNFVIKIPTQTPLAAIEQEIRRLAALDPRSLRAPVSRAARDGLSSANACRWSSRTGSSRSGSAIRGRSPAPWQIGRESYSPIRHKSHVITQSFTGQW